MSENHPALERAQIDVSKANIPGIEVVGIDNAMIAYKFTEGEFEGVTYLYHKVSFIVVDAKTGNPVELTPEQISPDDDRYALTLAFEFVVVQNDNGIECDTEAFRKRIGDILIAIVDAHNAG